MAPAARFVAAALGGKDVGVSEKLLFPIRSVVERLSTSDVNGRARHVAIASEFIRRNAASGIDVADVAAAAGVSVRLLQKDYRAITGQTVINALIDEKLARAKDLLEKTSTPVSEIALHAGFANATHMMTIFKKRVGMTMSAFRNLVASRAEAPH